MGFIVAHRDILESAKTIRCLTVRHPPSIVQETSALFLAHGYHDVHLNKLRKIYSQRWHIMREGIKEHLPMFSPGRAIGGTSFWLTGPVDFEANLFAQRLQKRGVLIEPGHIFCYYSIPLSGRFREAEFCRKAVPWCLFSGRRRTAQTRSAQ